MLGADNMVANKKYEFMCNDCGKLFNLVPVKETRYNTYKII
jgi:hypothetical protein